MASSDKPTIFLSDLAPEEAVHFTFADAEYDLSGSDTYDPTVDADGNERDEEVVARIIGEAINHPWLSVNVPVAPQDQAAADEEAAREPGVALDAGKDQSVPVVTGGIAETLAADDTSETSDHVDSTPTDASTPVADAPQEG